MNEISLVYVLRHQLIYYYNAITGSLNPEFNS